MIENFKISVACLDDLVNIYNLSNDPSVRQNSFNSDYIKYEDHAIWFNQKITDSNTVFYTIKKEKNNFVGYIKFDKNLNSQNKDIYIVTIHLVSDFRGKGLGALFLMDSIKVLFKQYSNIDEIWAFIKKNNIASLKTFIKSGFLLLGDDKINFCECFKLVLKNEKNFNNSSSS